MKHKWAFFSFFFLNIFLVAGHAYHANNQVGQSNSQMVNPLSPEQQMRLSNDYMSLFDRSRLSAISFADFVTLRKEKQLWQFSDGAGGDGANVKISRSRVDVMTLGDQIEVRLAATAEPQVLSVINVEDDGAGQLTWLAKNDQLVAEVSQGMQHTLVKVYDGRNVMMMDTRDEEKVFRQHDFDLVWVDE